MIAGLANAPAASLLTGGQIIPKTTTSLLPIELSRWRWQVVFATVLTMLMMASLVRELFGDELGALSRRIPTNPLYYMAFCLLYISPPVFDWLIFRKLWRIPFDGFATLMKKRIANNVVIGYSGEAYFYAWARARLKLVTAPFGTVKDVSILSAVAGNAITLAMLSLALPFATELLTPEQLKIVIGSAAVTFAMSLPFILFFERVFSLPKHTLWLVFAVHCLRLLVGSGLTALAWHFALPNVSIGMWPLLATARMLVSRLPLVPNKDLLFANFTILLIGREEAIPELIALTAALALLIHIAVLVALELSAIIRRLS